MDLDALRTFVKVAELASFTRAAEQLGSAKARVSTTVRHLETELGTRLLHRTTRAVRLTPDGEAVLQRAQALLGDAEQLQTLFQQGAGGFSGRLRLDLPTRIARNVVIPRLPEFLGAHPNLELELSTTDRRVDVVDGGFDCVLRVGPLGDSSLVARPVGHMRMVNCASPGYLQAFGTPETLDDLAAHRVVRYSQSLDPRASGWEYPDGRAWRQRPVPGVITVNNTDAYEAACLAGMGMIQVPLVGVSQLLAEGRLVEVLPRWTAEPMPVTLLYAARHNLPRRVAALLDWLVGVLAPYLATEQDVGQGAGRDAGPNPGQGGALARLDR